MTSITVKNIKNKKTKKCMCRDVYANIVDNYVKKHFNRKKVFKEVKGGILRKCCFGINCNNAHSRSEITIDKYIYSWNKKDKNNLNLINYYKKMLKHFDENMDKFLHNDKILINGLDRRNFIDILRLWRQLNMKYSRERKKLDWKSRYRGNSKPNKLLGKYHFKDDMPNFDDDIDDMWALYRQFNRCEQHLEMNKNIESNKCILVRDLCIGDINCKNGVHWIDHMVCEKDFMNGTCYCVNIQEDILKKISD